MAVYLVTLPESDQRRLLNKTAKMLVGAGSAGDALLAAKNKYANDNSWAGSGVTNALVTETTLATAGALVGWRFSITVSNEGTVNVVGTSTDDTIDEVAALLVIALNALTNIAGAAYNTTTQVLTVAAGSGGDDLGDETVTYTIYAPAETASTGQTNVDVDYSGTIVVALTHEGSSTDDLDLTFAADTFVLPIVVEEIKP